MGRTWIFLAAAFVAAAASRGGAGSDAAADRPAPVLREVSPSAVHAGDDLLLTAENLGRERPRVTIDGRRIPRRNVRRDVGPAPSDGARRLWARVPRKLGPGTYDVGLVTRDGRSAAAKPVVVASCAIPEPEPFSCGNVPNRKEAKFTVKGPGGFSRGFTTRFVSLFEFGGLEFQACRAPRTTDTCERTLNVSLPVTDETVQVGTVFASFVAFTDSSDFRDGEGPGVQDLRWSRFSVPVEVVKVTSSYVGICVNAVLLAEGVTDPTEVTVQGYVVAARSGGKGAGR
jgi:hypothetical protein